LIGGHDLFCKGGFDFGNRRINRRSARTRTWTSSIEGAWSAVGVAKSKHEND
jgi:hypothetical protein